MPCSRDNDMTILYDFCQTWSTLNVAILIILITNIYKVAMSQGITSVVPQCSFDLVIKTIKNL